MPKSAMGADWSLGLDFPFAVSGPGLVLQIAVIPYNARESKPIVSSHVENFA